MVKFKIGDNVSIRNASGQGKVIVDNRAVMTIESISEKKSNILCKCVWFEKNEVFNEHDYPQECLELSRVTDYIEMKKSQKNTFEVGDKVCLCLQSLEMVVEAYNEEENMYICSWVNKRKIRKERGFLGEMLCRPPHKDDFLNKFDAMLPIC